MKKRDYNVKFCFLISWSLAFSVAATVLGFGFVLPSYKLAKDCIKTEGIVTKLTLNNHNTVQYKYSVERNTFQSYSQLSFPNLDINQIKVSDRIFVFYDATKPRNSVTGDPWVLFRNDFKTYLLVILTLPVVVGFLISFKLKRL